MVSGSTLTTLIAWVVNLAYIAAILPQLYLNFKIKSVKGLSDFYLIGYFAGYVTNCFYVYSLNFNLAYKICSLSTLFIMLGIILQHFKYDKMYISNKIRILYFLNFIIFIFLVPIVYYFPKIFGHIAGWLLVLIWSVYQIPQIFKIQNTQSVYGFSFILVNLIGYGNFVELILSFLLKFPLQSYLIAIRGILVYIIFMFQFWLYGQK